MEGLLFCDGGARGNPGPAGAAAILYDPQGRELGSRKAFLGEATNNVAEYQGVLMGLDLAKTLGIRKLQVRLDSELVVRQLRGEYKVKHPGLIPLWEKAKQGLRAFSTWNVEHVPREKNAAADRLVNAAIDGA
jgi:ribonuclease HI